MKEREALGTISGTISYLLPWTFCRYAECLFKGAERTELAGETIVAMLIVSDYLLIVFCLTSK